MVCLDFLQVKDSTSHPFPAQGCGDCLPIEGQSGMLCHSTGLEQGSYLRPTFIVDHMRRCSDAPTGSGLGFEASWISFQPSSKIPVSVGHRRHLSDGFGGAWATTRHGRSGSGFAVGLAAGRATRETSGDQCTAWAKIFLRRSLSREMCSGDAVCMSKVHLAISSGIQMDPSTREPG